MVLKQMQLTLAIIKPHVLANPITLREIREIILNNHFKIVRSERMKLSQKEAEIFYKEHENKFFYNRLVTCMISGPIDLYIMARENAIQEWRRLMGPTKVFKTQFEAPLTIRGLYGLSDTRNATHGSDSEESARKEISFFFPDFNKDEWYETEQLYFKNGDIYFDKKNFVHIINYSIPKCKQYNIFYIGSLISTLFVLKYFIFYYLVNR